MNYVFHNIMTGGAVILVKSGSEANLTTDNNFVVPTHAEEWLYMLVFTYAST